MTIRRIVAADPDDVARVATVRIVAAARWALLARGRFDLAVPGGVSPLGTFARLAVALREGEAGVGAAHRTHVWFADERAVPPDHDDSNHRRVAEALIGPAGIPAANVHRMRGEDADLEGAAAAYAAALPDPLDLVVLGLGEDGHVASLFPHAAALASDRRVLAIADAPKPPARRLTLGPATLRAARAVLVLASGAAKAGAVARVAAGEAAESLPVSLIAGHPDALLVVDAQAAG